MALRFWTRISLASSGGICFGSLLPMVLLIVVVVIVVAVLIVVPGVVVVGVVVVVVSTVGVSDPFVIKLSLEFFVTLDLSVQQFLSDGHCHF